MLGRPPSLPAPPDPLLVNTPPSTRRPDNPFFRRPSATPTTPRNPSGLAPPSSRTLPQHSSIPVTPRSGLPASVADLSTSMMSLQLSSPTTPTPSSPANRNRVSVHLPSASRQSTSRLSMSSSVPNLPSPIPMQSSKPPLTPVIESPTMRNTLDFSIPEGSREPLSSNMTLLRRSMPPERRRSAIEPISSAITTSVMDLPNVDTMVIMPSVSSHGSSTDRVHTTNILLPSHHVPKPAHVTPSTSHYQPVSISKSLASLPSRSSTSSVGYSKSMAMARESVSRFLDAAEQMARDTFESTQIMDTEALKDENLELKLKLIHYELNIPKDHLDLINQNIILTKRVLDLQRELGLQHIAQSPNTSRSSSTCSLPSSPLLDRGPDLAKLRPVIDSTTNRNINATPHASTLPLSSPFPPPNDGSVRTPLHNSIIMPSYANSHSSILRRRSFPESLLSIKSDDDSTFDFRVSERLHDIPSTPPRMQTSDPFTTPRRIDVASVVEPMRENALSSTGIAIPHQWNSSYLKDDENESLHSESSLSESPTLGLRRGRIWLTASCRNDNDFTSSKGQSDKQSVSVVDMMDQATVADDLNELMRTAADRILAHTTETLPNKQYVNIGPSAQMYGGHSMKSTMTSRRGHEKNIMEDNQSGGGDDSMVVFDNTLMLLGSEWDDDPDATLLDQVRLADNEDRIIKIPSGGEANTPTSLCSTPRPTSSQSRHTISGSSSKSVPVVSRSVVDESDGGLLVEMNPPDHEWVLTDGLSAVEGEEG